MSEGLILITGGGIVVMAILALMAVFIEVIIRWDGWSRARGKKAVEVRDEDPARIPIEVVAAIGMALHQHHQEVADRANRAEAQRQRMTFWSSSGRLEIMAGGQRTIGRKRG